MATLLTFVMALALTAPALATPVEIRSNGGEFTVTLSDVTAEETVTAASSSGSSGSLQLYTVPVGSSISTGYASDAYMYKATQDAAGVYKYDP